MRRWGYRSAASRRTTDLRVSRENLMHIRHARLGLLCAALALAPALAGCVVERPPVAAEVVVPRRPPPPRPEVIPPRPRPAEIVAWRPGHWQWVGRDFVWMPGEWIERPRREARWTPGHWVERPRGWVWVEGR